MWVYMYTVDYRYKTIYICMYVCNSYGGAGGGRQ